MTPSGYDRRAELDQAYRGHAAAVRRHALRASFGDAPAADDATQEAFISAYRAWPQFRQLSPGHQRGWLSRAARNHIISSWRKTNAEYPAGTLPDPPDPRAGDQEEAALGAIEVARFWEAVTADLPRRAARAAYLAWSERWTVAAIARYLGADRATVYRDLRTAMEAARDSGCITKLAAGNEGGPA